MNAIELLWKLNRQVISLIEKISIIIKRFKFYPFLARDKDSVYPSRLLLDTIKVERINQSIQFTFVNFLTILISNQNHCRKLVSVIITVANYTHSTRR